MQGATAWGTPWWTACETARAAGAGERRTALLLTADHMPVLNLRSAAWRHLLAHLLQASERKNRSPEYNCTLRPRPDPHSILLDRRLGVRGIALPVARAS